MATNRRCIRTWKRDQSENVMSLEAAVANLKQFHPKRTAITLQVMLLGGEVLETPLASFELVGWAKGPDVDGPAFLAR